MGAVFGLFAGFYYWTPKIVGKVFSEYLGKIHFWTLFIGVNLKGKNYFDLVCSTFLLFIRRRRLRLSKLYSYQTLYLKKFVVYKTFNSFSTTMYGTLSNFQRNDRFKYIRCFSSSASTSHNSLLENNNFVMFFNNVMISKP